MGRLRLNKGDRVKLNGKGNRKAIYIWGIAKRADKQFKGVKKHTRKEK